jgi:hypothetical protein
MGVFRGPEENVRRLVGIATAVLAAVLFFGVAGASLTRADESAFDLRPQLMLRLFGEASDARAALAAAYGDRSSESPLRDLALRVPSSDHPAFFAREVAYAPTFALTRTERAAAPADDSMNLAQTIRDRLSQTNLRYAAPSDSAPVDA